MTAEPARPLQIFPASWTEKVYPAGDWALEERAVPRMVMGRGDEILWADQESFIIVADTGYGKSTLAQNIIKASIGLSPDVLGMSVRQFDRILYIAADRPPQIRASMARFMQEETREVWNEKLLVHEGPLGFYVNKNPESLLDFAAMRRDHWGGNSAQCLVIDSIKDLASEMSGDEDGSKYNEALQLVCRENIQVMATHHPRKGMSGPPKKKGDFEPTLDDIYGSKFIPAGAGSVLYLSKTETGSLSMNHLKAPAGILELPHIIFDGRSGAVRQALV